MTRRRSCADLPWPPAERGHRSLASRAQCIADALRPGKVVSKCVCHSGSPFATSMAKRSAGTPAGTAMSRTPCGVLTRSAMSGAKRLCISRGVLGSLIFHSSFMLPTFEVVKIFSSLTHPVRAASTPSVRKSEAHSVGTDRSSTATRSVRMRMGASPNVRTFLRRG